MPVDITWLGHSCFRLRGREVTVVCDPVPESLGYRPGRLTANVVTISHAHPNHSSTDGIAGSPFVVRGPGEYDVAGVLITGIGTRLNEAAGGLRNTIYIIEMEDLRICHLGDLGRTPASDQVEAIGQVDVLMAPVGGACTVDATAAAEAISLIEPRIVVPMHYKTDVVDLELEPVDRFLREMGLHDITPQPRITAAKGHLPEQSQVVLLEYPRGG